MRTLISFFTLCLFFNPAQVWAVEHKTSSPETVAKINELITSEDRSASHKARDKYRHPLQTLTFFGIEPDLTVVEIWPGGQGSWYRAIIEPLMETGSGTYIPVPYIRRNLDQFLRQEENVPYGEVDMVLVFRAHGFMIYEQPVQNYVDTVFSMLRPGGILAIADHAGDENIPQDPEGDNGYVNKSYFIKMAEAAGFVLLAESEINRNRYDTKDHPEGVWSLPPRLKGHSAGSSERQKYLDIGESDRFTLKFYKPEE